MRLVSLRTGAIFTALMLGGCAFNPQGAGIPKPATVAGYLNETTSGSVNASGIPLTAGEYLVASVSYTNEQCHQFFNDLAKVQQDSQILDKLLMSAVATGSPVLALTETAATVGKATSIINAVNLVNTNAAQIYLFAEMKDELETLIFREMAGVLTSKNLDQLADAKTGLNLLRKSEIDINPTRAVAFFQSREPVNVMIARNIATEYAAKCTVSNMRAAISRSVGKNTGEQNRGSTIEPATSTTGDGDRPQKQ